MLLLLGPIVFLASVAALLFLPADHPYRWLLKAVAAGWVVAYLLSLGLAFWAPVFYDNDVPETVDFPGHFTLALFTALPLQFVIVPLTAFIFHLRRVRPKAELPPVQGEVSTSQPPD